MNSESAQSSNKRLLDNDVNSQPEKQFKQEKRIVLKDANYLPVNYYIIYHYEKVIINNFLNFLIIFLFQKYEEETINLACSEKSCEIKESKNRNTYIDFVAKFEIPYEQFEKEKINFIEKLVSKNKETYHFSLSNILYEGTVSSSLMLLFQNKPGLKDEQFDKEVSVYENNLIRNNLEEEKIDNNNNNKVLSEENFYEFKEKNLIENQKKNQLGTKDFAGESNKDKNFNGGNDSIEKKEIKENKMDIINDDSLINEQENNFEKSENILNKEKTRKLTEDTINHLKAGI